MSKLLILSDLPANCPALHDGLPAERQFDTCGWREAIAEGPNGSPPTLALCSGERVDRFYLWRRCLTEES